MSIFNMDVEVVISMLNGNDVSYGQDTNVANVEMSTKTPGPIAVLRGHNAPVNAVAFLNDTTLCSGAADGSVKIWSLKTRRPSVIQDQAHSAAGVLQVARMHAEQKELLTHGRDGFIKVWDVESFGQSAKPLQEYYSGSFGFAKAATMQDANSNARNIIVCPSSENSQLFVYDRRAASSVPQSVIHLPDNQIGRGMCMALRLFQTTNATYLATGFESGCLSVLDIRNNGKLLTEVNATSDNKPLLALDAAQDGKSIFCGSADTSLHRIAFDESSLTLTSKSFGNLNHEGTSDVRIRPDQRIFASAGWDHRVRIFHLRTLKPLAILRHHQESVYALDFSKDSSLLASASKDHKLALWSLFPPDHSTSLQSLQIN